MAHLWVRDVASAWGIVPLEAEAYVLGASPERTLIVREGEPGGPGLAALLRAGDGDRAAWMLLAPAAAGVHLNGLPLRLGQCRLTDRDELNLPGAGRAFFSTETLARPVPFPAGLPPTPCPRCLEPIEPGTTAVRCPSCGIWHHEREGRRCWTYAPTCHLCPQPTALDHGYRWSPEEL